MDQNTPVSHPGKIQVETQRQSFPVDPATVTPPVPQTPRPRRRRGRRWLVWLMGFVLAVVLLGLLACALVGGLLVGIAIKLANEVTASSTSTQTFAVGDIPALDIHNMAGHVQVQSGAPGVVSVQITKIARDSSQSAARNDLDKILVTTLQTGDTITVTTDLRDENLFAGSGSVNLIFSVPPTTNITAATPSGNTQIDGITGLIEITGGAGNAVLNQVTLADGSRIHVTTGSVTLRGAVSTDATVDISVNTGDVTLQLPADATTQLDARTNIGDIHITGWQLQPSRTDRVGAFVSGSLGANSGGTVHVRVDTGDITVSQQ